MNIKVKLLIFTAFALISIVGAKRAEAVSYLNVVQPDHQPEGVAVTSPADNIDFFYFTISNTASSTEDLNLNRLVINNAGTSGQQARGVFSSLSLCATEGGYLRGNCGDNLITRTSVRTGRDGYLFHNFNYTIPQGQTRYFTILATVNVMIRDGLTIRLALNNANNFRAVGVDTGVRTQVLGNFPIQGNLFTIDSENGINGLGGILADSLNNPISGNVVAGTDQVPVLNLRFRATDHSFRITNLRFAQLIDGTTRSVDSLTLSYLNKDGNRLNITRNFNANSSTINYGLGLNNAIYVPADQTAIVNVYANLGVIGQNPAAVTGDQLKFAFISNQNFSARNDNEKLVRIVVAQNNQVPGNIMVVHGTLPTIEADPEAGEGNFGNGRVELYRFKVTAAEGTNLSLKKLSFRINLNDSVWNNASLTLRNFEILEGDSYDNVSALNQADTGANSYQIYNGFGATGTIANGSWQGGRLSHASGTLAAHYPQGTKNAILVFNDDRLITAGESKYYILRAIAANVDGGANSDDSLSTYMYDGDTEINDSNFLTAGCYFFRANCGKSKYGLNQEARNDGRNDVGAYFIWSDNTGTEGNGAHQDINQTLNQRNYFNGQEVTPSGDWFNGWKIKTLNVERVFN
ncbi:MAG: hypothetical protein WCV73_03615 [Patescibacteria group bacterium]|jgi:hypothetical protein